jgi:adenosylcobinamide kinase/adenosylcobinamide-phosphate guanylyltransferase
VAAASGLPVSYVATYCTEEAGEEMLARIELHRQRRPSHWRTIENRYDLRNQILENDGRSCWWIASRSGSRSTDAGALR